MHPRTETLVDQPGARAGCIDLVAQRAISGWAWDARRPGARELLWVEIDGELLGAVLADRFRPDLLAAGIGDGAHAFSFPIPDRIDQIGDVVVRFDDMTPVGRSAGFAVDDSTNVAPSGGWAPGPGCRFPSFFVLGAAKSGTTSLHAHLAQHAEICMSEPKEPFYFEAEYARGAGWYRNRYFAHWRGEPVVGEARHRNLYLPWVPERIHGDCPHARFIAIVRDPVDRLLSHWWHWYSRGLEPLSLEAAVDADLARLEAGLRYERPEERELYERVLEEDGRGTYRSYVDSGHYAEQLRRYVDLFGSERILVLRFDELTADPGAVVGRTLAFLGLDPAAAGEFGYRHLNRSAEGAASHLGDALRRRLEAHYAPHEAALRDLLETIEEDVPRASSDRQTRRST